MSSTTTTTETSRSSPLKLQSPNGKESQEIYKYARLLPVFVNNQYPPLTPLRSCRSRSPALAHPNPRAFLDDSTSVVDLTPHLGTEIRGVNLATLDSDGRDQLALEVSIVFNIQPLLSPDHCLGR